MIGDVRLTAAYYTGPMDNRPGWVITATAAFARGEAAYREGAEIIIAAMKAAKDAGQPLTLAQVAGYFGHKAPWASSLLSWHKDGCPPGGVFGREIASRRAMAKAEISTSKSSNLDIGPDRPWLPGIEGGPADDPPTDESEATRLALVARAACKTFSEAQAHVTREIMRLVFRWAPDNKQRVTLKKLAGELEQSITAGEKARDKVRAVLKDKRRMLEAAE